MVKHINGNIVGSLEIYLKATIFSKNEMDMLDPNDFDLIMLQTPSTTKAIRYSRMKAYGIHWHIANDCSDCLNSYDSGVAVMESSDCSRDCDNEVVGVLQQILKLDYGPSLNTPIYLLICEWRKHQDTHVNKTYVRDPNGFLAVNFKYKVPKFVEPYAFPKQYT